MLANALITSSATTIKRGLKLPNMTNFLEKREKRKKRDMKRPIPHTKYKNIIHMDIVI